MVYTLAPFVHPLHQHAHDQRAIDCGVAPLSPEDPPGQETEQDDKSDQAQVGVGAPGALAARFAVRGPLPAHVDTAPSSGP
jgi:hypothetical protein